jgi:uncharacterized protein (TIGR02996 family)
MPQQEAFLQAIIESPADDTPRLVYADWLDDHGQPDRAEFIRVQIDLARLADHDLRRRELERREGELLAEHEEDWLGPLARWACGDGWRRGFNESIKIDLSAFLGHAAEIFRATPVRRVLLSLDREEWRSGLTRLLEFPELGRVADLVLEGYPLRDRGVQGLAASPHLRGLTALSLEDMGIGRVGAAALAASPHLGRLERLNLDTVVTEEGATGGNHIGTEGVRALGWSPHLSRLHTLRLAANGLNAVALRTLSASPLMGRLAVLGLHYSSDGVRWLRGLTRAPAARGLKALDLAGCWSLVGPAECRELAASPFLTALQTLDIRGNAVGLAGLEALASSPHLQALAELSLDGCWNGPDNRQRLGRAGLDLLLASPLLERLTALSLRDQGLAPGDAQALAASPRLSRLGRLDLGRNPIGAAGLQALAASPHLIGLTDLGAGDTDAGPEGVRALVATPQLLARLRALDLSSLYPTRNLGDEGVRLLASCPHAAGLRRLNLDAVYLTEAGVEALASSPYLRNVWQLSLRCFGRGLSRQAEQRLRARWGSRLVL